MTQFGHIVKPNGNRQSYSIIYRDPDGRQRWEGKFKWYKEAKDRLKEIVHEIDHGSYIPRSSMTFEEFADNWLERRRSI